MAARGLTRFWTFLAVGAACLGLVGWLAGARAEEPRVRVMHGAGKPRFVSSRRVVVPVRSAAENTPAPAETPPSAKPVPPNTDNPGETPPASIRPARDLPAELPPSRWHELAPGPS